MLAPLHMVAGAPGAGKTFVLPHLVEQASGLVVMDMDELLEDGALLGVPVAAPEAAPVWPAYDRMWRRMVNMVRRVGHPVVLLRPTPSPADLTENAPWDAPVRWCLLDCPDAVRSDRLRARGWDQAWIDDAVADAADARTLVPGVIQGDAAPSAVAGRVLDWVRET